MVHIKGNTMNIDKLREELTFDEGCINKIYLDHLGYPTFGIGHLVLETDPEHGKEVGTPVSEERIKECFENDIENVFNDLDRNIPWWRDLPKDLILVIANMSFNLGITRLLKFKNFLKAMEDKDWDKAAVEMIDSRWAIQVGPRAVRLKDRVLKGDT
jgi:lysozyme|tara:strand:- start:634 stop:1104 length:471 start_codon:yes stop_codon:yes gene_type:complete